jgi:hypothetical protein
LICWLSLLGLFRKENDGISQHNVQTNENRGLQRGQSESKTQKKKMRISNYKRRAEQTQT